MGRDVDVRWEMHLVRGRFGVGVEDEGKVYVKEGSSFICTALRRAALLIVSPGVELGPYLY